MPSLLEVGPVDVDRTPVTGRFAPSPTGPLHFGSAVAAIASFLQVRSQQGRWLVRIDDLDPPREPPGAVDAILHSLDALKLHSDAEIVYQSQRLDVYHDVLEKLRASGKVYDCACSRKDVGSGPYSGTCRNGMKAGSHGRTVRLRVDDKPFYFDDRLQGRFKQRLESEIGDFILRRADGLIAYHLAVVIDDDWQGVTEIVRGVDLMDSTPRQIFLQACIGIEPPIYAHLPMVLAPQGHKLSKQTFAPALDDSDARRTFVNALTFLGQVPPTDLERADLADIHCWAIENWRLSRVPISSAPYADEIYT